jgi:hypothetical protein
MGFQRSRENSSHCITNVAWNAIMIRLAVRLCVDRFIDRLETFDNVIAQKPDGVSVSRGFASLRTLVKLALPEALSPLAIPE